jgi:Flp pilus assembly pilin Flp
LHDSPTFGAGPREPLSCLLRRLRAEESGQALVEYALLTAFVALVTIPAVVGLQQAMKVAYERWNTGLASLWAMPASSGGGS